MSGGDEIILIDMGGSGRGFNLIGSGTRSVSSGCLSMVAPATY